MKLLIVEIEGTDNDDDVNVEMEEERMPLNIDSLYNM